LLTGHKPYHLNGKDISEINRFLENAAPLKPSSACQMHGVRAASGDQQVVVRQLRGDLDKIVFMAMRKESDRRYSGVDQLADDIKRHLDGRPVLAQNDTFGYRASKFVRRNKAGVTAGLGISTSLVVGLFVAARQARNAARERDHAREETLKTEKVNHF